MKEKEKEKERKKKEEKRKKKPKSVYNPGGSQVVSLPSTNPARSCLTSEIGRDPVLSAWYGRRRKVSYKIII